MRGWREPAPADAERHDPAEVSAAGLRNHHVANTAYPLAHERTWAPYRVPRAGHGAVVERAWEGLDELGLYVHLPFCETRCSFCEYTVVPRAQADAAHVERYLDALLGELALWDRTLGLGPRRIAGLDFGGGTPTYAPARQLARVLDAIRARVTFTPDADISIETTPSIAAARPAELRLLRAAGFERISMGVQVIQPDLLRALNRSAQGVQEHLRAVEHLRAAGFERFNVDLMYGFAGQSLASWEATLAHAIALGPEAITLYRMRYKLTRISHQAPEVTLDAVRPMGRLAKQALGAAGYHAPPGKTTYTRLPHPDVGTSRYLERRVREGLPYLGLGLGAQSLTHTTISYADGAAGKDLAPWLRSLGEGRLPLQDLYDLPQTQVMAKTAAVAFYFGEIERAPFLRKYGLPLEVAFAAEVAWLTARGWMRLDERALSLTPEGAEQLPGVIPLFYAPSAQRYLLERDPDQAEDLHRHRRVALRVAGAAAGEAAGEAG